MSDTYTLPRVSNRLLQERLMPLVEGEAKLDLAGTAGQDATAYVLADSSESQFISNALMSECKLLHHLDTGVLVTWPIVTDQDSAGWIPTPSQRSLSGESNLERLGGTIWINSSGSGLRHIRAEPAITSPDVGTSFGGEPVISDPVVQAFCEGLQGVRPDRSVTEMAVRITEAALDKTVEPEVTLDVDGALSFDLRLTNGLLILAELDVYGGLDASVYDDHEGILVQRLAQTTESELIGLF